MTIAYLVVRVCKVQSSSCSDAAVNSHVPDQASRKGIIRAGETCRSLLDILARTPRPSEASHSCYQNDSEKMTSHGRNNTGAIATVAGLFAQQPQHQEQQFWLLHCVHHHHHHHDDYYILVLLPALVLVLVLLLLLLQLLLRLRLLLHATTTTTSLGA